MNINNDKIKTLNELRSVIEEKENQYEVTLREMLEEFLKNNNLDNKVRKISENKIGKLCIVKLNRIKGKLPYAFEFRIYNSSGDLVPSFSSPDYAGFDLNKYLERIYTRYESYNET